eukprot:TRINITY_DN9074_c0_g1_i1.p1 TRINITY_DN9074_c0_g1~~TRINITY_DN9074_c0_g1_i1.p1  ORF type:complete len:445 (+),score=95.94 TRINITY_DN9074_c0_g1_i1:44-1336(+)
MGDQEGRVELPDELQSLWSNVTQMAAANHKFVQEVYANEDDFSQRLAQIMSEVQSTLSLLESSSPDLDLGELPGQTTFHSTYASWRERDGEYTKTESAQLQWRISSLEWTAKQYELMAEEAERRATIQQSELANVGFLLQDLVQSLHFALRKQTITIDQLQIELELGPRVKAVFAEPVAPVDRHEAFRNALKRTVARILVDRQMKASVWRSLRRQIEWRGEDDYRHLIEEANRIAAELDSLVQQNEREQRRIADQQLQQRLFRRRQRRLEKDGTPCSRWRAVAWRLAGEHRQQAKQWLTLQGAVKGRGADVREQLVQDFLQRQRLVDEQYADDRERQKEQHRLGVSFKRKYYTLEGYLRYREYMQLYGRKVSAVKIAENWSKPSKHRKALAAALIVADGAGDAVVPRAPASDEDSPLLRLPSFAKLASLT